MAKKKKKSAKNKKVDPKPSCAQNNTKDSQISECKISAVDNEKDICIKNKSGDTKKDNTLEKPPHVAKSTTLFNMPPKESLKTKSLNKDEHVVTQIDLEAFISSSKVGNMDVNKINPDGLSILAYASSTGQLDMVNRLLDLGAKPDFHGKRKDFSPLLDAAQKGYHGIVELLIKYGADINMVGCDFNSALHLASIHNHFKVVELLINSGAKFDSLNDEGFTPLLEAAEHGSFESLKILIKKQLVDSTNKTPDETSTKFKETPLTISSYHGYDKIVEYLLESPKLYKPQPNELEHALFESSIYTHIRTAKLLISHGASVNVTCQDHDSPLSYSISSGNLEFTKLLLENGASLSLTNEKGLLPLIQATKEGYTLIVQELLENGADPNITSPNSDETALSVAISLFHLDIIMLLVSKGADYQNQVYPAIFDVITHGHDSILMYLLSLGIDVNKISDKYIHTLLTHACEFGTLEIVQLLLRNGANVDLKNHFGLTPLMYSISSDKFTISEQLIRAGANPNIKSTNGSLNPLLLACNKGNQRIVHVLLQHGADPSVILKESYTPLIEASRCGHLEIIRLLFDPTISPPSSNSSLSHSKQNDQFEHSCSKTQKITEISQAPSNSQSLKDRLYQTSCSPKIFLKNEESLCEIDSTNTPRSVQRENSDIKFVKRFSSISSFEHNLQGQLQASNFGINFYAGKDTNSSSLKSLARSSKSLSKAPPNITRESIHCIDVNVVTDTLRESALTYACSSGNPDIVELLVNRGANIDHRNAEGFTPLMVACHYGHYQICKLLIEKGASVNTFSEKKNYSPLTLAINSNSLDIVKLLVQHDADLEHICIDELTPISLAAHLGHTAVLSYLIEKGADAHPKCSMSPLMIASRDGHPSVLNILFDKCKNLTCINHCNQAFLLACSNGKLECVEILLDKNINIETRSKLGYTPLMEAAIGNHTDVGAFLIKNGAEVNACTIDGSRDTLLMIAAERGHHEFIEMLEMQRMDSNGKIKFDINAKNKRGCTALWLAANNGFVKTVEKLVNFGATACISDARETTALVAALKHGHIDVVKYLGSIVKNFPADKDCEMILSGVSLSDKLYKEVHKCVVEIVRARDKQQDKALLVATELFSLMDQEIQKKEPPPKKRDKKKKKKSKQTGDPNSKKDDLLQPNQESKSSTQPTTNLSSKKIDQAEQQNLKTSTTTCSATNLKKNESSEINVSKAVSQNTPVINSKKIEPSDSTSRQSKTKNSKQSSIPRNPSISESTKESSESEGDDWQVANPKKTNVKKENTARVVARAMMPPGLVSRFIGRDGNSINIIRLATNTTIDIDSKSKNPATDAPITIRGFIKDVRAVLSIVTALSVDPLRTAQSAVNELDYIVKTYQPGPYSIVGLCKDLRLANAPSKSTSFSSHVSESSAQVEHPRNIVTKRNEVETPRSQIRDKNVTVTAIKTQQTQPINAWSINTFSPTPPSLNEPPSIVPEQRPAPESSQVRHGFNYSSIRDTSHLRPGRDRPLTISTAPENEVTCPIWNYIYNGDAPVGVLFDARAWMQTSTLPPGPLPPKLDELMRRAENRQRPTSENNPGFVSPMSQDIQLQPSRIPHAAVDIQNITKSFYFDTTSDARGNNLKR